MESYDKKNRISGVHGVGIDDADAGVPTIRARAERVGKFAFRPSLKDLPHRASLICTT